MTYTKNGKTFHCPVEAALDVIGGVEAPYLWALGMRGRALASCRRRFLA
jgi:hypothetical protein